jgi:demethylmenaquinone methyltransferase/2-methoxy-6-polyprenyl-1,4-benzoquinol methylase
LEFDRLMGDGAVMQDMNVAPATDTHLAVTFDWMADRYLDQTVRVSWGRYPDWMRAVARLVAERQPHQVVDIGAGPGYLLRLLAQALPTATLTAVDISGEMLARVSDQVTRFHESLEAWAPSHPRAYDAAVMTFVLRDLARPAQAIAAVGDVLKPGGRLVILETHAPEGWREWGFQRYFHELLPRWGDQFLTPDWPGAPEHAPYRWLSATQRRWHRGERLAGWLRDAGFTRPIPHFRPIEPVMLWSAVRVRA